MKYNDTATDVLSERPPCDICGLRPAAVDGKTHQGPWAYMCIPCYEVYGVGLGLGVGQRLLIDEAETIPGESPDPNWMNP